MSWASCICTNAMLNVKWIWSGASSRAREEYSRECFMATVLLSCFPFSNQTRPRQARICGSWPRSLIKAASYCIDISAGFDACRDKDDLRSRLTVNTA